MTKAAIIGKNNRVIRSYFLQGAAQHYVIFNEDQKRLEITQDIKSLKDSGVNFEIVKKFKASDIKKSPILLEQMNFGPGSASGTYKIGLVTDASLAEEGLDDLQEDEDRLPIMARYSAMGHVGVLVFCFVVGFIIEKYFIEPPLEMQTIVVPTQEIKPQAPERKVVKTVKMSEKPIKKKPIFKRKIVKVREFKKVKIREKRQKVTGRTKGRNPELGALATLSAIGGIGKEKSGPRGTGYGSKSGAMGSGAGMGGGLGKGNVGGVRNALGGKGLVAGFSGDGSRGYGAAGYGNGNLGGGRKGRAGGSVGDKVGGLVAPSFDDSEVEGGLAREQVEAVVRKNSGQLLYCYERALQSNPSLRGRLTSKWVIAGNGRVRTVKILSSSLRQPQVESCVVSAIRGWIFPKPIGGVNVDVAYPFDFGRLQLASQK